MVADAASGGGLSGGGSGKGWDTQFNMNDLDKLKQMVQDAKPQTVKEVAQNWTEVKEHLVGSDGAGGLKLQFDNAVKKVLEKWKGASADKFREEADKISQEMAKGGGYAERAGTAMDNSADNLYQIQDQVQSIDVSWWDEAWDTATDMFSNMSAKDYAMMIANPGTALYADYQLYQSVRSSGGSIDADLASGIDTQHVIDKWGDKMGAKKQAALQAAQHLEQLGSAYKTNASALKDPGNVYNPPKVKTPDVNGPGDMNVPGAGGTNPGISGGTGIGGGGVGQGIPGFDANGLKPPTTSTLPSDASQIGTGLESAGPGLTTGGGSGIGSGAGLGAGGGVGGGGAGLGGAGGGIGGGMAGGLAGGLAGGAAGLARGAGGAGARGAGAAGRGLGAGAGGAAGRGTGAAGRGMGGMGGGAGAGGAAGRGTGGAGRTGASARTKGGVIGGAKGKTGGAFTPGGTGLRNRGGAGAGAAGRGQNGRNGFGPAAAGGRGAGRQQGEGGNNSRRPDYLVEDEDTWTPKQRKANPPVIE
ncbi:hypothetical protein [Streptomyces sp. WG-D5]